MLSNLNLTIDHSTKQKRDRATIRDVLLMRESRRVIEPKNNDATKIRQAITKKLQKEVQELDYQ